MYSCHSCISELYDYDLICTLYLCHFVSNFLSIRQAQDTVEAPDDRGELLQLGREVTSLLPLVRSSLLLSLLLGVFLLYAVSTLLALLLIIFSIWL